MGLGLQWFVGLCMGLENEVCGSCIPLHGFGAGEVLVVVVCPLNQNLFQMNFTKDEVM